MGKPELDILRTVKRLMSIQPQQITTGSCQVARTLLNVTQEIKYGTSMFPLLKDLKVTRANKLYAHIAVLPSSR